MAARKSSSKRTSAAPAQRNEAPAPSADSTKPKTAPAPFPRNLPMYFKGKQQSAEFARGSWAACDTLAKMHACDPCMSSSEELTAAHADEFNEHAAKGGDYSRGFVTAMVEFLAFEYCVGGPNLDVWRPLSMEPRFTNRGAHPTPGSTLYELDGEAVSVAPDCTVYVWCGGAEEQRIERGEAYLARVRKHGRVLSQREFDAMWTKVAPVESDAPASAAPAVSAETQSTPMDLEGHPAHKRIDRANLAVHQLVVLTYELRSLIEAEDEDSFLPMAIASRAHRLADAASRLLSLPADEIDFEACEAEVLHG